MAKMMRDDAETELEFILDTLKGELPLDPFNNDWHCFSRYAQMQATCMGSAGHDDLAYIAQAAGNRARRKGG